MKRDGHGHMRSNAIFSDQVAKLFLRPKMVRVRLLSRGFFSDALSFLRERPERTDRESDTVELSSMYLSL